MIRIEQIRTWVAHARILDLSKHVVPGGASGPFETGKRRYEITPFTYPPGELMHMIEMESHISTHVEAPSHYVTPRYGRKAADVSEVPLERFFGVAILVSCLRFPPRTPIGKSILKETGIQENDIVLFGGSRHPPEERCYLAKDGAEYLVERKIKMAGIDDTVFGEDPEFRLKVFEKYYTHDTLLSNGIPLIEGLCNLDQLTKERFFFVGIPASMGGLESFPIRAVAVEI